MSEGLSREDAREILKMIADLAIYPTAVLSRSAISYEDPRLPDMLSVGDRALKMLEKLSQQESHGKQPE
jgi:hypothetical protein